LRLLPRKWPLTIRRRVALSFIGINILFALNVGFFAWSNYRRKHTVDDLRRAIVAGKAISDIEQGLNNIQKQVALLSQAVVDSAAGASPEEVANFQTELEQIRKRIVSLKKESRRDARRLAGVLETSYAELSAAWLTFFQNFGIHHATAITVAAMRAEPLSQRILQETVPALLEAERRDADEATANFDRVARLTDTISLLLFVLSGALAIAIGYHISHYLTTTLGELKLGVALIGSGHFEHQIHLKTKDELGDLASAFNDMADNLTHAKKQIYAVNAELETRNRQVEHQSKMSEALLLNILPAEIAKELRENETVEPKYFEDVTILFTDFVGFTLSTERLAAENLVYRLHEYFTQFDQIASRYGIEKLKTIGDAYMCVSGMPGRNPSHPVDMVLAAMEMLRAVETLSQRPDSPKWSVRIGIHTGPVIAGVVGIRKFAFDIWGDSVNFSSRMESSGAANRINVSERTYSRVKDFFRCDHRGKIPTKDKREVDMYFVEEVLPELMDGAGEGPPAAFSRRYRIYFQKTPPAFPEFLANRVTAPLT
jgi:class 3 adenylate cyclase/HAMP domain-containing protein